ncbi:hypothetical protein WJX73_008871 [Symbiochloris irregularis]|uniref:Iron hydrogenase small subunit domain-containing protein n=1 Tax=Symbiochloris irregularis TaxID=706552 RepID=A0AAW1NN80_9CHLO
MANFSGAIKLTDLNDFIAPSQACTVALNGSKLETNIQDGEVLLHKRAEVPGFSQTLPSGPNGSVKVTLHDCLACSGCVTSAETVLLEHQSTEELSERLADPSISVIVSVSPQSLASLSVELGKTIEATFKKLSGFLRSLGVLYVLDTVDSRDLSLLETASEFVARYRAQHGQNGSGKPPAKRHGQLLQLASACPGWVCYAEKTHGDYILPYISTAKSPQAVIGSIVKGPLCKRLGIQPGKVYHCTIMPCYDKKLEASREDFTTPGEQVPETDCVLTTEEVLQLASQKGIDLALLPEDHLDNVLHSAEEKRLYGWPGGSGGYLQFVMRVAAQELFGHSLPPGSLPMRTLRNADFQETVLEIDGREVLRFAQAYGFRNIQTVMRQVKQNTCRYHYVEIMACPSGCLNGGGQIKPHGDQAVGELLHALDKQYHDVPMRTPSSNPMVDVLYRDWVGGFPYSEAAQSLLHTQYHNRGQTSKPAQAIARDW